MGASESRGRLRVGQMVKVEEEKSSFQQLQRKHGGWHEAMIEVQTANRLI